MAAKNNEVSITWMGTAGVLISDSETGILIDPYVSRFGIFQVAFGARLRPDQEAIKNWKASLGKEIIKAVAVSHSHFDHLADAPYFAMETDAVLLGSESTINVGRGAGMAENLLQIVHHNDTMNIGTFSLRFIESAHGPAFLGRVPYPGKIDKPLIGPQSAKNYKLGQTFSILISHPSGAIVHHGSAGLIPGMYDGIKADVVLLGIIGRGDTHNYLQNIPVKLGAKCLIPIHFDNFFVSLEKKMRILPTAGFKEFLSTAESYRDNFELDILQIGEKAAILPERYRSRV
ncbi:MAG: MBL fold metallo-hydrolase [Smithella sp.]|nr:MBL fold metallo-hydrolase [Smithella sp.]